MARTLADPREVAAAAVAREAARSNGRRKKSNGGPSPDRAAALCRLVGARVERGDERLSSPNDLVALYGWLHLRVYGVLPGDLSGKLWLAARSAAAAMLAREFRGEYEGALEFLRWVWARERRREADYRQRGESREWRVTWRAQFVTRGLLTDYRVAESRRPLA